MLRKFVFAIVAVAAPGPALAQVEQTIEGAQKFLEMTLPGNAYSAGSLEDAFDRMKREQRRSGNLYGKAKIVDASVVEKCKSKMLYDVTDVYAQAAGAQPQSVISLGQPKISGSPDGFPFAEVKKVEQRGSAVDVLFKGNETASTIYLGAEDLAARVAYAMEFLRIKCDPTAATGF